MIGNIKKSRILIIPRESYPTNRVDITTLFSKYLSRTLKIDWLMRARSPAGSIIDDGNDQTYYLVARNLFSQAVGHTAAMARIVRGKYDIVQCRDTILVSAVYALVSKISGKPFVYWMSFPIEESYIASAGQYFSSRRYFSGAIRLFIGYAGRTALYRLALPLSSCIFVQSNRMKEKLVETGVPADKITPVPMCIDTEIYSRERCEPSTESIYLNRKVVLYIGSIEFVRKMEVSARGVAKALSSIPNSVFVVIGKSTAEDRAKIESEFSSIPSQLVFLDQMPLAEALRHVRRADVCISPVPDTPLLTVGTPTKLVEYLAMGARVVANRHPDQEYILGNTGSGILCDFSSDDFARATMEAIEKGPLTADEIKVATGWIKANRDYASISRRVAEKYRKLVADTGRNQAI